MATARATGADFGETVGELTFDLGNDLLHQQVVRTGTHDAFSQSRKHPVHVCKLPSRSVSMSIGDLDPGQATNNHRHTYETVMYILEGEGHTVIEGHRYDWKAGDALYVPGWAWHQHFNTGSSLVRYAAATNAPLVQNLGIARREEA